MSRNRPQQKRPRSQKVKKAEGEDGAGSCCGCTHLKNVIQNSDLSKIVDDLWSGRTLAGAEGECARKRGFVCCHCGKFGESVEILEHDHGENSVRKRKKENLHCIFLDLEVMEAFCTECQDIVYDGEFDAVIRVVGGSLIGCTRHSRAAHILRCKRFVSMNVSAESIFQYL